MSHTAKTPLEWIRLELIPLPDKATEFQECEVWWNYVSGEMVGDVAEDIIQLIKQQLVQGSVTNSNGTIELNDPFHKTTELASILGQYFWVIPVPVAEPGDNDVKVEGSTEKLTSHPLQ